jgi:hypothetical protein
VRHNTYKYIRELQVRETPRGRGLLTTIEVRCDDNGQWQVNGVPVPTDTDLTLAFAHIANALAHERDAVRGGQPANHDRQRRAVVA